MRDTSGNDVRLWLQGLLCPLDPRRCKCFQPVCVERMSIGYSAICIYIYVLT